MDIASINDVSPFPLIWLLWAFLGSLVATPILALFGYIFGGDGGINTKGDALSFGAIMFVLVLGMGVAGTIGLHKINTWVEKEDNVQQMLSQDHGVTVNAFEDNDNPDVSDKTPPAEGIEAFLNGKEMVAKNRYGNSTTVKLERSGDWYTVVVAGQ